MIVRGFSFRRWWAPVALFLLVAAAAVAVQWYELRGSRERAESLNLFLVTSDIERRLLEIHRRSLHGLPAAAGWNATADALIRDLNRGEARASNLNRDAAGSLHEAMVAIGRTKELVGSSTTASRAAAQFQREIFVAIEEIGAVNHDAALASAGASTRLQQINRAAHVVTVAVLVLLATTLVAKRRMRRKLERAAVQQRMLLEMVGGLAAMSVKRDGALSLWNSQLEIALGRSEDEMRGIHVRDLVVEGDLPAFEQAIAQARERNVLSVVRARIIGRYGEPTLYEWTIKPTWDDESESNTMIAGLDVSMSERLIDELRASEARYRHFHETIPIPLFRLHHGIMVDTNPAHCQMLGYTRDEIIGQPAMMFTEPAERDRALAALGDGETLRDYEAKGRRKDGTIIDTLITMVVQRAPDGSPIGFEGVAIDVTRQRAMEAALRQSEQDYRGIFDNAHDAIVIIDPDSDFILDANHRACEMYGYAREQFIGMSLRTVITEPEKVPERRAAIPGEPGEFLFYQTRHRRRDGSLLYVAVNVGVVQYGGRRAFLVIINDRTQEHFARQRLRESEEKFRLLLDGAVDYAICLTDATGIVESWNEGAARIIGYAPDEILGRHIALLYPADDQRTALPDADLADATTNGRATREGWRVRKGGETFFARSVLNAVTSAAGQLRGFALVMQDITEHKRAHDHQLELNAVLADIAREWTRTFDAVVTPILLVDDDAVIHRANLAAFVMAGLPIRDLLGKSLHELVDEPWTTARELVREVAATSVPVQKQLRDELSGRQWELSASAATEVAKSRIVLILRDLTKMKELEAEAARGQMWSALGSLVSGIAHEVRNPLFSISSTLDAFEARFGERQEFGPYAVVLRREIERLTHLMRELLDYGRPHSLVIQPMSLAEVAEEAVRNCAPLLRDSRVSAEVALETPIPQLQLDESRILQVFQNLIENAVQHSPAQTCVSLRLRHVTDAGSDVVEVEVRDRGTGFQPEDLPDVIAPFFTRRKGGTGLGLSIVKRIVEDHGGEIAVANHPDGGAIVRLRFASRPASLATRG